MVWIHICSIYSTAWKSKYDIKCVTKYMRVCLLQFLSSEAVWFFFFYPLRTELPAYKYSMPVSFPQTDTVGFTGTIPLFFVCLRMSTQQ